VRSVAGPDGCSLDEVLTAGGIGVALCAEPAGQHRVVTIGADGALYEEGTLALARAHGRLTMAADGTLLYRPPTGAEPESAPSPFVDFAATSDGPAAKASPPTAEERVPWVRRPLPLGAPQAWRPVRVLDAVAHLVLPGGAVLVAAATGAEGSTLELWLDTPTAPARQLAGGLRVRDNVLALEVRDGELVLVTHPIAKRLRDLRSPDDPALRRLRVMNDGTLEPLR
jgi:hypothetical protein